MCSSEKMVMTMKIKNQKNWNLRLKEENWKTGIENGEGKKKLKERKKDLKTVFIEKDVQQMTNSFVELLDLISGEFSF